MPPAVADAPKPTNVVHGADAVLHDLENGEEALTFAAATEHSLLKKNGKGPHLAQIHRWHQAGLRGVRLEAARIAGPRVTTRAALLRFLRRLNGDVATGPTRTDAAAAENRAKDECDREGI